MSQLGFGVMINMLGGNEETVKAFTGAQNKTINSIEIVENELLMRFDDGTGIKFFDDGQSCCEHRYMNCDDDLSSHKGEKLIGAEVREGGEKDDEYGVKEDQFLVIQTDNDSFTVANYNEHNGYYGGFYVVCREISQ